MLLQPAHATQVTGTHTRKCSPGFGAAAADALAAAGSAGLGAAAAADALAVAGSAGLGAVAAADALAAAGSAGLAPFTAAAAGNAAVAFPLPAAAVAFAGLGPLTAAAAAAAGAGDGLAAGVIAAGFTGAAGVTTGSSGLAAGLAAVSAAASPGAAATATGVLVFSVWSRLCAPRGTHCAAAQLQLMGLAKAPAATQASPLATHSRVLRGTGALHLSCPGLRASSSLSGSPNSCDSLSQLTGAWLGFTMNHSEQARLLGSSTVGIAAAGHGPGWWVRKRTCVGGTVVRGWRAAQAGGGVLWCLHGGAGGANERARHAILRQTPDRAPQLQQAAAAATHTMTLAGSQLPATHLEQLPCVPTNRSPALELESLHAGSAAGP